MSISEKLKKLYKNIVENIKKMSNGIERDRTIGALVVDLGKRSINALSKILNCSWRKVKKCYELVQGKIIQKVETRGRKKLIEKFPNLVNDIKEIISNYESTDSHFKNEALYVDLTLSNLKRELIEKYETYTKDTAPSKTTLWRIVKNLGYRFVRVKKSLVLKKIEETDVIFDNVHEAMLFAKNSEEDTVVISIDDKANKKIGDLSDNGKSWIAKEALDHDTTFETSVTPFGILDLKTNETFVYCTEGKSTAEFKVDCIDDYLSKKNNITTLIIFLDNGPENSGRRRLWLKSLVKLAKKYNISIELVYYPPYHSKYNMIERYWAKLQITWNGIIIDSLNKLIDVINKTEWKGIKSNAKLITNTYETGVEVSDIEMDRLEHDNIFRDEILKNWSIVIAP